MIGPLKGSPKCLSYGVSSHQTKDLECFADRKSIPQNLPTIFHQDLIATVPHPLLFLICVVFTYSDSRKDVHKLCQIPRNCQCKWLQASYPAPRTFASSIRFPEKFLFCTDTPGSIGWPSLAPRLHIDDCFEIHILHWELLWSAVIKSPKLSARGTTLPIRLLHGALVILVLWQISQSRSFGKWVLPLCLPKATLLIGSKDDSWEELACESLCSGTLSSTRFSLNFCNHYRMSE